MVFLGQILISLMVFPTAHAQKTVGATAPEANPARFTTTIQIAVQEPTPKLAHRSQQLVINQFAEIFDTWAEFHGQPYKVQQNGTELVFHINAEKDLRRPMQQAMAQMIHHLNGRVRARGRSQFYRTSLSDPMGGFLEVVVDDSHTKVHSITAQSVPLRDILKEIQLQVNNISYLVPGNCAEQSVEWSFGSSDDSGVTPKSVDSVMKALGALFGLSLEKQEDTYIFSGSCENTGKVHQHQFRHPVELIQSQLWKRLPSSPAPTRVLFPIMPLSAR